MRREWFWRRSSPGWRAGVALLLALASMGWTTAGSLVREGWDAYQQGEYENALTRWSEAAAMRPDNGRFDFLRGNALYRLGRFEDAVEAFSGAYQGARTRAQRNRSAYNLGNAFFRLGLYQQAVEAYENALQADSSDEDARYNLELARRRLQQQPPPSSSGEEEQQQPPPPRPQGGMVGGGSDQPQQREDLSQEEVQELLDYLQEQERLMRRYFNPRPGQLQEQDPSGRDFFSMTRKELEEYIERHQDDLFEPFDSAEESTTKDW